MKTNELRLGNYILIDCIMYKEERKVTEICPDGVFAKTKYTANMPEIVFIKEEDIEPIELTEDVLVKIGFEGEMYEFCLHTEDANITVNLIENRVEISFFGNCEAELCIKYNVKYLHELQNAYYCLTNQEMEVKL